jgi:mevalonate kinase
MTKLQFKDYDQKSQKEMEDRKENLIHRFSKKYDETMEDIKDKLNDMIYWMNECNTEEDKNEVKQQSMNEVDELTENLYAYNRMLETVKQTEPHELKVMYFLSDYKRK